MNPSDLGLKPRTYRQGRSPMPIRMQSSLPFRADGRGGLFWLQVPARCPHFPAWEVQHRQMENSLSDAEVKPIFDETRYVGDIYGFHSGPLRHLGHLGMTGVYLPQGFRPCKKRKEKKEKSLGRSQGSLIPVRRKFRIYVYIPAITHEKKKGERCQEPPTFRHQPPTGS